MGRADDREGICAEVVTRGRERDRMPTSTDRPQRRVAEARPGSAVRSICDIDLRKVCGDQKKVSRVWRPAVTPCDPLPDLSDDAATAVALRSMLGLAGNAKPTANATPGLALLFLTLA